MTWQLSCLSFGLSPWLTFAFHKAERGSPPVCFCLVVVPSLALLLRALQECLRKTKASCLALPGGWKWAGEWGRQRGGAGQAGTQSPCCLTLTQLYFLCAHSVTSLIKGTITKLFSQRILTQRSHPLPEQGLREWKQGANTFLRCRSGQVLFTSSSPAPNTGKHPPPNLKNKAKTGEVGKYSLLPFHSGLCDCELFSFSLKQCFYEMP